MAGVSLILTAATAGLSQFEPIRGTIADTGIPLGIDQRLQQQRFDMVLRLPITDQTPARQ